MRNMRGTSRLSGRKPLPLLLSALIPLLGACTPWQQVTPPGGEFSVLMPEAGQCIPYQIASAIGPLAGSLCDGSTSNVAFQYEVFTASVFPLPKDTDLGAVSAEHLQEILRQVQKLGGRVLSESTSEFGGITWTQVEATVTAQKEQLQMRDLSMVRPEGVFELQVMASAARFPDARARKFFSSFKLNVARGAVGPP